MAARARGRGIGYGIDGAILETRVGSTGTALETATSEAGGRKSEVRNVTFGAGAVQSRAAGTQERFPRCRTPGEAAGGPGIDSQLCTRCRAASMADGDAPEGSVQPRSRAGSEAEGVDSARRPAAD